jgi:SAM-dependent methyltransferase
MVSFDCVSLRSTRENWDDLAALDTYWAILGYPDLRSGKWDERDFFRTGEREIDQAMTIAAKLGCPQGRDRALDFGCGVGRLTRALAGTFAESYGVDISGEMISRAEALNSDVANCRSCKTTRTVWGCSRMTLSTSSTRYWCCSINPRDEWPAR